MKYQKEISVAAIAVVVLLMVFKPSVLGILYNNVLGKLFLVACIVFLTLKHTIAGLLGVVFIAVIASNSMFEGVDDTLKEGEKKDEKKDVTKDENTDKKDEKADEKKDEKEAPSQVDIATAALKALSAN
jgi:hypothetical protein